MEESLIGDENLQTLYRWKALDEENMIEQSSFALCITRT
jgi:hypothetical protein